MALVISQLILAADNWRLRDEIEEVRLRFGYLRIENNTDAYIARIGNGDLQDTPAYRLHLPAGNHFLLHLSVTDMVDGSIPDAPPATKTVSLNSWKHGADVVLKWLTRMEDGTPRIKVATESQTLLEYKFDNWKNPSGFTEGAELDTNGQMSFSTNDSLRLMWWRNPDESKVAVLWMEPADQWTSRQAENAG